MIVGAFIESDGIGSRGCSPPPFIIVVETERADKADGRIGVKVSESFGSRIEP
jgi:hypothetical protein